MPGFELLDLEVKDFMSYGKATHLIFRDGHTVITGRTGSGKTSLLDAITFSLFGSTARTDLRMIKTQDICRPGGYAAVTFRSEDHIIKVKRGRASGAGKSYLDLTMDGTRQEGKIPELNAIIQRVIGLSYKAFCHALMVRQGEVRNLGDLSPTDRLDLVIRLFRLDIFSQVQQDLKAVRREKQHEKMTLEREIENAEKALEKRVTLETQIQDLQKNEKEQQKQVKTLKKAILDLDADSKPLFEKMSHLVTLEKQLENISQEIISKKEAQRKAEIESSNRELIISRIMAKRDRIPNIEKLRDNVEQLKNRQRESNDLKARIEAKNKEIERIKEMHDQQKRNLKEKELQLKQRVDSFAEALNEKEICDLLRNEGRFEERISRIDQELEWIEIPETLRKHLRKEKSEAMKTLVSLKERLDPFPREPFLRGELLYQLKDVGDEVFLVRQNATKRIQPLNDELQQHQKEWMVIQFTKEQINQLTVSQEELQTASEQEKALRKEEQNLRSIPDQSLLLKQLAQDLERFKSEKETVVEQINDNASARQELEQVQTKLKEKRQEHLEVTEQVNRLKGELKSSHERLSELNEIETHLGRLEANLHAYEEELTSLTVLDEEIFHRKGVPYYAIARLMPQLGKTASLLLAEMTDQRYTALQLERTEKEKGAGLNVTVVGPEGPRDVAFFSGGEKTQINLALRLAISMELARIGESGRSAELATLVLDEADFGSLDPTNSQPLLLETLLSLQSTFRKVILITHLEDIARKFTNRIIVDIDDTGRSQVTIAET